jgi:hypothetical protein
MIKQILFVIIMILIIQRSTQARLYFGADWGANSNVGLINAITFFQERYYVVAHLDIENKRGGYIGLSYRIPIKHIGYIPIGICLIGGGEKNDYNGALGLYTGFQRDLTKNTMVYIDTYYTPINFQYRKVQHFNIAIGLSIAIFNALGDLFTDTQTTN